MSLLPQIQDFLHSFYTRRYTVLSNRSSIIANCAKYGEARNLILHRAILFIKYRRQPAYLENLESVRRLAQ